MIRATKVLPAGQWDARPSDTVVLDYDQRHRRRMAMRGRGGIEFLLDLSDAVPLRDGDALALDDGSLVAVAAAPEPLAEIHAHDAAQLLRIAWHLGNRHLPAQLTGDRIRIRRDHVIEDMVAKLGAHVHAIDAPFDPEGGAYAGHHHGGGPSHSPGHDHDDAPLEHDDRIEVKGVERG